MTEEIKYNKDEKWVPYEQLAETPQQTIARLEQENEKLKKEVKQIGSDFIKKGDYARELEQENEEIYENGQIEITKLCNEKTKYRSALEEIKAILDKECGIVANAKAVGIINEVLE